MDLSPSGSQSGLPAGVTLRAGTDDDLAPILAVHRAAFGSELEPELARRILVSGRSKPAWSILAAEEDGAVIGHVLVSYADVEHDDGGRAPIPTLAPVAVVPDWQGRGVGGALVREAQVRTASEGETSLVVEGDWRYYERFGFTTAEDLGLRRPHDGISRRCFMVLALDADAHVPRGRFAYPPAFDEVEGPDPDA